MCHLIVSPLGPFGYAVAERLRDLCRDVDIAGIDATGAVTAVRPAPDREDRLDVLVAWRRAPAIEQEFDDVAFRTGRPWLPVVLDHPVLEIGPLVVPGEGACHGCYRRRIAQHDTARTIRAAVDRHYDTDPQAGPAGYLTATALFAAASVAEIVDRFRAAPGDEAGRVRQIDVPTQQLRSGRVVGVHGCPRCGSGRDETTRSYDRLPALLQGVWS
ncbi:hypothetical protein Aph02nite_24040 [Actinoplanes philippinensis]|uniref:Bacteriocin biosynthesis cyclodehydratase domain-containing protein n=1 Tax=Actinoplanes philippinensis TaxID=35752 RepID=A0A1I2FZX9_9ACTN|nr:TOMM precursor leader peptide-binding protein [Actinoplanes philippinensis]GIE76454.1 hypothetical protein Aph02nite_24040 [Actinoplanes philippinensis]SFF10473.1 bacteriocin biosynthesis cyclodehydratase domain-containing protein [Actinoplanes philippinensis]